MNLLGHARMAIVNHQISVDMLGSDLVDAAAMLACISEGDDGRKRRNVSLAVRCVRQNVQVVSLAHTPLEQTIDRNSIMQEFVWKLKRHLYIPFNGVPGDGENSDLTLLKSPLMMISAVRSIS